MEMEKEIIKINDGTETYTISKSSLLSKIATYIYVVASHDTTNGTRYIYFDGCDNYHWLPEGWTKQHVDEIIDVVNTYFAEMVSDIWADEDAFDVGLYHNFVMGYIEDDQSLIENRRGE